MQTILVTGGAGYIGSHTAIELLNLNYNVIIVDNFSNSNPVVLQRIQAITGKSFKFYTVDLLQQSALECVFADNKIDSVIHFAGFKAVGESVSFPLKYYNNNIVGTLILCNLMSRYKVNNLVFSSSATVYGPNNTSPLTEDMPPSTINPYGTTKLMIEMILHDWHKANHDLNIAILRYFNPIGAHESGLIGEDPNGIPNNLMPFITQVAAGKRQFLNVFGNDYDTHDGTGIRDYIHVVDLAHGHIKALNAIKKTFNEINTYNLGTGIGYSVLDIIKTFESVNGIEIPYKIVDRRTGDIATCYANPSKALTELGWKAQKNIMDMCRDAWRWQSKNPNGYAD